MTDCLVHIDEGGEMVDEMIMERVSAEERETLIDELMDRYGTEILRLVYSYVHNYQLAEDLTQDIFVKSYKSLHTYKGKSSLRTWLWKIAINHCKDYLKSWYNNHVIPVEDSYIYDVNREGSAEEEAIQQEEDERLVHSVMGLPVLYREVIYLHYYEDIPIREMARILSVNPNTVKTRLRRAKSLLKERWEE